MFLFLLLSRDCGYSLEPPQSDTKKQATENHKTTTALERSEMNYWGGLKHVLWRQSRLFFVSEFR